MTRWIEGKRRAQPALQRVDRVMPAPTESAGSTWQWKLTISPSRGLAHAHVVHLADRGELGGERGERLAHFGDARARSVEAGQNVGGQRLDMGLDLDVGAELLAHRFFEPLATSWAASSAMAPSTSRSTETASRPSIACTVT